MIMNSLVILALLCSVLSCCSAQCTDIEQCNSTYMVVVPQQLRAGRPFDVSVHILKAESAVTVVATLYGEEMSVTEQGQFNAGEPGQLQVMVPSDIEGSSFNLQVVGSGGLTFNQTQKIYKHYKSMSILIQTDKATYKPGDLVRFRTVSMFQDLKPFKGEVDVEIKDSKRNKVKQWRGLTSEHGVNSLELQLTEQTNLGSWTITVKTETTEQIKVFKVAEYVLPKYEVTVDAPSFLHAESSQLAFTVQARYTYGENVKGTAHVQLKAVYYKAVAVFNWTMELVDGKVDIVVSRSELGSLVPPCTWCRDEKDAVTRMNYRSFNISATVVESLTSTELSLNGGKKVPYYTEKHRIKWLESTPTVFKAGLTWVGHVQITQADGTPPDAADLVYPHNQLEVDFRNRQTISSKAPITVRQYFTIPASGVVEVRTEVEPTTASMEVMAKFKKLLMTKYVQTFISVSGEGIQISLMEQTGPLEAGSVTFSVKCTKSNLESFYFQMYSKGELVFQDLVSTAAQSIMDEMDGEDSSMTVLYTLNLTPELAQASSPKAKVLVWYLTGDGEVIVDSIQLSVDALFSNKVQLAFSEDTLEPGNDVKLVVSSSPDSYIAVLAVDQSVLLLDDGNDITQSQVEQEMSQYSSGRVYYHDYPMIMERGRRRKRSSMPWPWFPIYSGGKDAQEIFQNVGVYVLTDAYVHNEQEIYLQRGRGGVAESAPATGGPAGPGGPAGAPGLAIPSAPEAGLDSDVASSSGASPETSSIREDFPETWIWLDSKIGNGTMEVYTSVPDTITSWVASAFAMSSSTGLGITEDTAKLTVKKPFFISLNLPYSVIRKEEIVLSGVVFNYLDTDLQVDVILSESTMFKVKENEDDMSSNKEVIQRLTVPSSDGTSFKVTIIPEKIGSVPVEVRAQSNMAADALRKMLLVEPEGDANVASESTLVRFMNDGEEYTNAFQIDYPTTGLVPGSERVEITAMGDPMGKMLGNLNNLIRMPYGCGEQNILTFSPNVYALLYLEAMDKDDDKIKKSAEKNMEAGYQRQLTYQRKDGSFSAFGERDASGSTWLSAFTIRSFNQARRYLSGLDQQVLDSAMNFIINQQQKNGSFSEPGRVRHQDMQGGASQGISLTAFTLISLLENFQDRDADSDALSGKLQSAINHAVGLLTSQLTNIRNRNDTYAMSLVAYALTMHGSSGASQAVQYLEAMAMEEDGMKYWKRLNQPACVKKYRWSRCWQPSNSIEMTSYAMLTYLEGQRVDDTLPIAKWLTAQQSSLGGYHSTQDTLIALLALTKFTIAVGGGGSDQNIQITVTAGSQVKSFNTITKDNNLIVQRMQLPVDLQSVQVSAVGKGIAVLQLSVFYHQMTTETSEDIIIKVRSHRTDHNEVEVTTCARWQGEAESGMMLMEIMQMTGHVPSTQDLLDRYTNEGLKRVEQKEGKLSLYFDELNSTERCITTLSVNVIEVHNLQPKTVRVSSYYSPEKNKIQFYHPDGVSDDDDDDVNTGSKLQAVATIIWISLFVMVFKM